jgi:mRNA interferase RelE/StbE
MAGYSVFFRKSVQKDLDHAPKKDIRRILERIERLAVEPRPKGCEKLTGQERYRMRRRRYHIAYSIQDEELTVWVIKRGHRKDI